MAGVTISYKGSQIASMTSAGTKTLTTSGQYCEDNITVGYSAPSLESVTINAGNLLSQNTTFNSSNLVLYENNNFSKKQNVGTEPSYKKWFDPFISINLNEKIHLYMNLSFLCSDIDETIIIDCDYTVLTSVTDLSFTSSSQSSNIKYFGVFYTSNELRFGFAKNNGNPETVQITGQIIITKIVDGIDTINLNLIDNPLYLNIYKSLAYRSIISASVQGVSEWVNSLSVVKEQQFAGQPFSGSFVFNNVKTINTYGFGSVYGNTDGVGIAGEWNGSFPSCSLVNHGAFVHNRGLIGVNFPSCTIISNYAFVSCSQLTSVSFPVCTIIGSSAFQACHKLQTIEFPNCTTISSNAFSGCTRLTTVNFPSCTTIESCAFWNCPALSSISFPICTTINTSAFASCSNLATISFPVCTTINNSAFYQCSNLTIVNFPSCTTISAYAFASCSNLATISFPVCTLINNYAFASCSNLITINFPSCTTISSYAFTSCTSLTTVNFPSCTTIGSCAFYKCFNLTSANFPVCTTISGSAFASCSKLETISFPSCITIGNYAFSGCSKLSQAYFMGSSIVSIGTNVFYQTPMYASTYLGYFGSIYVPSSLLNSYKTATNWAQYSNRIIGI